jgi:hypothetical protein
MNGPILREQIFRLMLRLDQCDDPDTIIQLQFQIEGKYDELSCLTGVSPASLEAAILDQYPAWVRKQQEDENL